MSKSKKSGNKNGMNWITQVKRLAIYMRDGLACAYCGQSIEAGASLCLDHLVSRCDGGSNHASNLVTACKRCNDSKNSRSVAKFADAVAAYVNHGLTAGGIVEHVRDCVKRTLPIDEARDLIALRGSAAKVLAAHRADQE